MKLFYRKLGKGPPLIILHGLYGSSDNWMSIAKKLSDNYTVFIPDQRNHGRSPHSNQHDYSVMASDLEEFIQDHIRSKVILIGHSMGGKTAIFFAHTHPEALSSLIIIDISPFNRKPQDNTMPEAHERIIQAMLNADISSAKTRGEAQENFLSKFGDLRIGRFLLKNLYKDDSGRFAWRINVQAIRNSLEHLMAGLPDPSAATTEITGFPVLFLRGEESDYIPESHLDDIKRLFPAADIITVAETSHWLHAEKPEEITTIIRDFLSGNY
jgi:esterase